MTAQPLRHPPAEPAAEPAAGPALGPVGAPVFDTALGLRCRARAKAEGPAPALAELRAGLGPDARAWGPGGHALLPLAAAEAPGGAPVATLEFASGDLGVWRDERHRDGTTGPWTAGVLWIRLGLTEQLLRTAADHLAGRRVGGEVLAEISSVRTRLGEAAADLVEARLLLEHGADDGAAGHEPEEGPGTGKTAGAAGTGASGPGRRPGGAAQPVAGIPPGSAAVAADALVRAQRAALRLLGAAGYLDDGPGRLARAVDLLADVHPVAADPAAGRHATEVSP
ncbi:acyl-CoA dehydrogenase family protein [Streptomyces sp. 184]|uniref:acyl-CoA dehydrogenase family protein n=1 Tax=Streptomyces sp. 184 TaxID=1827526 RepID=UPI003891C424